MLMFLQELVGSRKKRPYKKYLLIALIFLIVIGIIVVVVVYVNKDSTDDTTTTTTTSNPTDPTNPPIPQPAAITLEDFLDNKLYAKRNNATWISGTELLYRNTNVNIFSLHAWWYLMCFPFSMQQEDLVKYNVETKTLTTLLGINESVRNRTKI